MSARRFIIPGLFLLAAIPRLAGLGYPDRLVFDETHYARDACVYVGESDCELAAEENLEHPPLGKWLIGVGIALLGNDAFGWRVMSAVAGSISVLLLYVLALRLSGSTRVAVLASGLLALDPLHLVQSRVAMVDIFVLAFGLGAIVCAERGWTPVVGGLGGAAIACKWSGLAFLVVAGALLLHRDRRPLPRSIGVLIGSAMVVYVASYLGRVDGFGDLLARQADMWSFHAALSHTHPYASSPLSWLLVQRPVAYLFGTTNGKVAEIMALGNPLLWWPALGALGFSAWRWRRAQADRTMKLAVVGFAATFGMWVIASAFRSTMFLFYMVAVLPFMYLALASLVARWGAAAALASVLALASFVFFWPVVTAEPLTPAAWHQRLLFEGCEVAEPLIGATPGGDPAPPGWCWI